ncbi:HelD family protein [Streptosporangium sp. CA-115845]|uniref:HelD family protein n=1 Tax=Streptosporangium sp. CA-115845 TaxID=3240071 RepID=UPI003D911282
MGSVDRATLTRGGNPVALAASGDRAAGAASGDRTAGTGAGIRALVIPHEERIAVIAEEQRAVDHAYDCVERRRLGADRVRSTHGQEHPDAGLPFVPDVPPEFGVEDDLGEQPLVFMRVDVADDPDGRETWRIGRRAVRDAEGDLVVISWTTEQAVRWMKARASRPGEIRLRRKLRLHGRTVTDYLDDIRPRVANRRLQEVPEAVSPTEEPPGENADAFLLADLDRARDGLMRDIVETIQRDQLDLVSDGRPGVLVVQGGPGTGKTAVGLHRVVWLLDPTNRGLAPDDVLVIGPHRGFLRYVSQVLPRLGSRGVATVEVARLWDGEVRAVDTPAAHLVKSDERMAEVLRRVVESGIRPEAPASHISDDVFSTPYRGAALTLPGAEIEALAVEARDSSGPYLVRRRKFVDTFVDRLLSRYAKALPGQRPDGTLRSGIEKHGRVASLINAVWPALNAETILRRTLNDPDAIHAAAPGVLTEQEREAVLRPRVGRASEEPWTLDDLVCLEELRHLLSGDEPRRYRHIVVDEAQDLTPMQARSIARRCPGGSMTVLGDLAQTTGTRQYDVWGRLAGILSGHDGWHLAELAVGYRVPDEVMRFAAPLARAVSLSTTVPVSVRPADETSLTITRTGPERLADEALARALDLATADLERSRSVALIAPDGTALLEELERKVAALQGAVAADDVPPVSVLPATMARGLEFDHVVVVEPAAIADQGPAGPRRLYVAITRCTQSLTVVHAAPLPAVLGGPEAPAFAAPGEPATSTITVQNGSALPVPEEPTTSTPPVPEEPTTAEENTTMRPDTPATDESFRSFVSSLEERVGADRQCHVHEQVRYRLIAELHGARLAPSQSPLADIVCKGPRGAVLYEVLGEGGHTYERMREAVLRIMEVEHVGGDRAEHLFLVLPQAPEPAWAPAVLSTAFDIATIWRDGTGWAGEELATALGQAPD